MKKKFLLSTLLCALAAVLLLHPYKQDGPEPSVEYGPMVFSSLEELAASVDEVQKKQSTTFTRDNAQLIERYTLNELTFCYVPGYLPSDTALRDVRVKNRYVSLYYTLDTFLEEAHTGQENARNELLDTIIFSWTPNENGDTLLRNTIEQQELQQLEENQDIWYSDIFLPDAADDILGKQMFFVQDGYYFQLYLPMSVYVQAMEHGITSVTRYQLSQQA